MHIFHDWSKWFEIERGDIVRGEYSREPSLIVGKWMMLRKDCKICGMIKCKKILI